MSELWHYQLSNLKVILLKRLHAHPKCTSKMGYSHEANLKLISLTVLQQWFKSHLGPHAILILEVLRAQHGSNLAAEFTFSLKQSLTEESTTEFNLKLITAIPKSMLKYELEMTVFSVWENRTWQVCKLMKIPFSNSKREYKNPDYTMSNHKQNAILLYVHEIFS